LRVTETMKISSRVFVLICVATGLAAGTHGAPPERVTFTKGTGELSFAEVPARGPLLNTNTSTPTAETPSPTSPREYFNTGTKQLGNGKLKEAEASLESALASQEPALQPVALYNLGHVRFKQGIEQLMKGPPAKPSAARARNAGAEVKEALKDVDDALAGDEVSKMVAAYMRGRGARKEAREALKVVERALEAHGGTLKKWQRSEGDFQSTVELKRSDDDAHHNADVVDRCIAKLVDSMRELQQAAMAAGDKGQELKDKLGKLKGKIPAPDMPPGGGGDDEEDEDNPNGPKPGDKEGPSKDGKELAMSPEQAGWLLDALRPGGDRRLPMGQDGKAEPKDPNKPTW
jgi:hypothetical protein